MATNISSDSGYESNDKSQKSQSLTSQYGSAAFQSQYFFRDTAAGLITGAMAIPL